VLRQIHARTWYSRRAIVEISLGVILSGHAEHAPPVPIIKDVTAFNRPKGGGKGVGRPDPLSPPELTPRATMHNRRKGEYGRFLLVVVVPLLLGGGAIAYLAAQDIGPAWDASFGDPGRKGVFVATEKNCDRFVRPDFCTLRGDFKSDDGDVVRRDVALAPGHPPVSVGSSTTAYDTGARKTVYPPGGAADLDLFVAAILLIFGLVLLISGLAILWFAAVDLVMRRRASAAEPATPLGD
jgi:hypothetical protein